MKDKFELVYYIVFNALMLTGVIGGLFAMNNNESTTPYIGSFALGFSMTLARFIYNGQHFWNPPELFNKLFKK